MPVVSAPSSTPSFALHPWRRRLRRPTTASRRAASARCLDGRQGDAPPSRLKPPEVDLGGVHPPENDRRWTVVARDGTGSAGGGSE